MFHGRNKQSSNKYMHTTTSNSSDSDAESTSGIYEVCTSSDSLLDDEVPQLMNLFKVFQPMVPIKATTISTISESSNDSLLPDETPVLFVQRAKCDLVSEDEKKDPPSPH